MRYSSKTVLLSGRKNRLNISTDPVEAVNDDGTKLVASGCFHHFLESRTIQVAAGEALVLINGDMIQGSLIIMGADVFFAKFYLVADAFSFAGEAGFAGIDGDGEWG